MQKWRRELVKRWEQFSARKNKQPNEGKRESAETDLGYSWVGPSQRSEQNDSTQETMDTSRKASATQRQSIQTHVVCELSAKSDLSRQQLTHEDINGINCERTAGAKATTSREGGEVKRDEFLGVAPLGGKGFFQRCLGDGGIQMRNGVRRRKKRRVEPSVLWAALLRMKRATNLGRKRKGNPEARTVWAERNS